MRCRAPWLIFERNAESHFMPHFNRCHPLHQGNHCAWVLKELILPDRRPCFNLWKCGTANRWSNICSSPNGPSANGFKVANPWISCTRLRTASSIALDLFPKYFAWPLFEYNIQFDFFSCDEKRQMIIISPLWLEFDRMTRINLTVIWKPTLIQSTPFDKLDY